MKKVFFVLTGIVIAAAMLTGIARADTLQTHEYAVTATPSWETTPRLGNDGVSDLVVFTRRDMLADGTLGKGDIWYQRLAGGALSGAPVQVTSGQQDNQLNDISGDYIVYTAYDSTSIMSGSIMLYQISTTVLYAIGNALIIQEPRICGNKVVWREGGAGATQVLLYDLGWLGTTMDPTIIAGPIPSTFNVNIGERFVVWAEYTASQYDLAAFDLAASVRIDLTATPLTSERMPSTSGAWVTWQAQDKGSTSSRIVARNIDTAEERIVADNGAQNLRPTIDGDLIAYESTYWGPQDVVVYRLSTVETFRVTNGGVDHYLNDVFGQSIAYVDQRSGNEDIYVSDLTFVPPAACYPNLPSPVLAVTGREDYTLSDGSEFTRYHLSVSNWSSFPDDLFAAAPDLPSCGLNTNSSRTWVYIYGQGGAYIYGLCGLDSASMLKDSLWFAEPKGTAPPAYVYITLTDRRCNKTYTSNPASTNLKPVANAGADQTVHTGSLVTLDGSGSSDPDGNYPLAYAWAITLKPAGSAAALTNPTAVNPSFTADLPGDYEIQLVVTDSLGLSSDPATVKVSTTNTAPVAAAGPDQAATLIGAKIQLDGSQSYDPDGDPITYLWSFVTIPQGSAAKLSNPAIINPTFIADVHGTYVAQLVVRDPWSQSAPSKVTISFENIKPVADAGTSQSAVVGDTVTLNGSGSSDANNDPLRYQWSFTSVPAGSASSIASPTSAAASFVPDLPGAYVAQLIVNDGFVNSDPSTVQIQVVTAMSVAVQKTKAIQNVIASLSPSALKNANLQNALINKLNAVLANINAGNYASALDELQNDILLKTDGCATAGAPDKNDWINNCASQGQVYPMIMDLIALLKAMP
jgi:hypothetical protein